MQVRYPTSNNKKTNFTEQETSTAPQVTIQKPDAQYTLVMVDPDAGNRTPGLYYLHWLIVNIPATGDITQGDVLVPYAGPTPPPGTGQHKYHFILYKQSIGIVKGMNVTERPNWNLENFLKGKNLTEVARQTIHVPPLKLNGNK